MPTEGENMPGRRLCSEEEALNRGFKGDECARRRSVLRETLEAFQHAHPYDKYHAQAARNLAMWQERVGETGNNVEVRIVPGDWGEVTLSLTREFGTCFAVLNMANAYVPGGAYVEGAVAQEENMFRRTDCHFRIGDEDYDPASDRYREQCTNLLLAKQGRVYLDIHHPRVCIRGPEDRTAADLGYRWLSDDEVFPFYELRAAAQDLRGGKTFQESEARRRIEAQFETLQEKNIKHVVFSAFGCGAFLNPADQVARLYRSVIEQRASHFRVIAFAIFHAGYGRNNFAPFEEALRDITI